MTVAGAAALGRTLTHPELRAVLLTAQLELTRVLHLRLMIVILMVIDDDDGVPDNFRHTDPGTAPQPPDSWLMARLLLPAPGSGGAGELG